MNKDMTSSILMLVLMFAILYFLLIRPQKKKEKQVQDMRNALKTGDEIVTIGGIYGKIVSIKGDKLIIQTGSDRTKLEMARWAISGPAQETESAVKTDKKEEEKEERPSKPSAKSIKKLGQKEEAPVEPAAAAEEAPAAEE